MNIPVRQNSTTAVISLVAGILGWTVMPFIGSLVAIICGHIARNDIRRNPETLDGDGLAIAGLVLGWSMVAVSLIFLTLVILFFGGIAALLALIGITGHF